jgi:hypothetical protein
MRLLLIPSQVSEQLNVLTAIRTSLSGLTQYHSQYAVAPYDDANGATWNSSSYVSAVMPFDLLNVFGPYI